MSYLNNGTRASALTINGADYTSSLLEFTVSDASAYKNGCLVTSGEMTLGMVVLGTGVECESPTWCQSLIRSINCGQLLVQAHVKFNLLFYCLND